MTGRDEFADTVMRRLPKIDDERDAGLLREDAARMGDEGWSLDDAVALLRLTEEVNPLLAEDVALRGMAKIRAKYPKRILT